MTLLEEAAASASGGGGEEQGEGWKDIDVLKAAKDGNIDDVDRWIGGGGDLEVTDWQRYTPLIMAALWARMGSVCGRSTDGAFSLFQTA